MPADLEALVATRDHRGLAALLAELDDAEAAAARRWYRATGRRQAAEATAERNRDAGTVVVLLAVGLAGARDAARACDFPRETRYGRVGGTRLLAVLEIAARRGPGWCRDFVEAVSQRPVLQSWASPDEVVAVCLPLVAHHGLDVPAGPAYAHGWASLAVESQRTQDVGELENHLARLDGTGRASYVPGLVPSAGFRPLLAATPQLQQTLERVLETPRALSMLTYLDQPGWSLGPAVADLVADGLVCAPPLVDAALRALTSGYRPSEQRVATTFLDAAGFGAAEAAVRVPFLLQVLATAHGSVTSLLLPVLLAVPLQPDDLRELGSVVLLRREKAQKVVLLDQLEQVPHDDPRAGTVIELLREAARLDDRALAGRAENLLRSLGAATGHDLDGPLLVVAWDDPPEAPGVEDFQRAPATAAGLAQLRAEQLPDLLKEARWLDLAVRRAASDAGALRSEIRAWPPPTWVDSTAEKYLIGWATGVEPPSPTSWLPVRGHRLLATALAAETVARLGRVTELLSTPSREDGTIAWTDLVDRLRRAGPAGYAPADLLQALLRLDPVRADELTLLDGLVVAPHLPRTGVRHWWSRRGPSHDDAASVVRAWIEGGGLPQRRALMLGGHANLTPVRLPPVPPALEDDPMVEGLAAGLRSSPADLPDHGSHQGLRADRYLAVVPWWAEVLAADGETARLEHRGPETAPFADVVRSPGPFGPAVHLQAARLLGGWDPAERSRAVELVLAAVSRRRLDPDLLADQYVVLLDAGVLSLARTSDAWEQVVLGGGLAFVWPSLRAVLERGTTTRPLPGGLAELLRMVRPYLPTVVANVGGDVLPAGVAELAGSRTATKARAEARALLEALTLTTEAA